MPARPTRLTVEPLEARHAPATLVGPTTVTYQDVDGDAVTVTLSRPVLTAANVGTVFVFNSAFGTAGPQQLRTIDLHTTLGAAAAGTTVTVTATRSPAHGGDGFAAVGQVDGTGIDLGKVTIDGDLGRILAGDGTTTTPGLAGLAVHSLGRLGTTTGAANLTSTVQGALGALRVADDVKDAAVVVTGGPDGRIGSVFIGGSLIGGAAFASGQISTTGDVGPVTIGGDLVGGAGNNSGTLFSQGRLTGLTIGGSVRGGAGQDSGDIGTGSAGRLVIRGDVVGGGGPASAQIEPGSWTSLTIGGSVRGGDGASSGFIESFHDAGPVTVHGDLAGGAGNNSGRVVAFVSRLAGLTIGGSVVGGAGASSGLVAAGDAGPVSIRGDLSGGVGPSSGELAVKRLASLTVGGSVRGGAGSGGGLVLATGPAGAISVAGDVVGGSATGTADLNQSGFIHARRIASLTIGGSLVAGTDTTTGTFQNNGAVRADDDIGSILIKGGVVGNPTNPAIISARGQAVPAATADVAIGRLTVRWRVEFGLIQAGVDAFGTAVNADAQIGQVVVGEDWIASSLAAGAVAGADGFFGDGDDAKISGTGVKDNPGLVSQIGSLTIGGQALGTTSAVSATDFFGIVAEVVGAVKVGGVTIPTTPGAGNDNFTFVGITGDFKVNEI
jgi:hypothetical protein